MATSFPMPPSHLYNAWLVLASAGHSPELLLGAPRLLANREGKRGDLSFTDRVDLLVVSRSGSWNPKVGGQWMRKQPATFDALVFGTTIDHRLSSRYAHRGRLALVPSLLVGSPTALCLTCICRFIPHIMVKSFSDIGKVTSGTNLTWHLHLPPSALPPLVACNSSSAPLPPHCALLTML
jgi:hypothetical protein